MFIKKKCSQNDALLSTVGREKYRTAESRHHTLTSKAFEIAKDTKYADAAASEPFNNIYSALLAIF